jgi:hypothetical protein
MQAENFKIIKKLINSIGIRFAILVSILFFINSVEFLHHHSAKEDTSKCFSCQLVNSLSSVSVLNESSEPEAPHLEIINFTKETKHVVYRIYFKNHLRAPPSDIL